MLLHSPGGKKEKKVAMTQSLTIFSEKYEDEAIFAASQCGLPVRTSMKPESVSAMVNDVNIMLTRLIIIYNYMRYAFEKRDILPEECSEDGIEVETNRIFHRYEKK